jgi:hypothetical protein
MQEAHKNEKNIEFTRDARFYSIASLIESIKGWTDKYNEEKTNEVVEDLNSPF